MVRLLLQGFPRPVFAQAAQNVQTLNGADPELLTGSAVPCDVTDQNLCDIGKIVLTHACADEINRAEVGAILPVRRVVLRTVPDRPVRF